MTVDCHKLNQLVTSIVATVSEVILILKQIDMLPSSWHASVDVTNATLIYTCYLFIGNCLLSPGRTYTRAISATGPDGDINF